MCILKAPCSKKNRGTQRGFAGKFCAHLLIDLSFPFSNFPISLAEAFGWVNPSEIPGISHCQPGAVQAMDQSFSNVGSPREQQPIWVFQRWR